MKKLKLKVGDYVWVKLPDNAFIDKVTPYGYVLRKGDERYQYFSESEVHLVEKEK